MRRLPHRRLGQFPAALQAPAARRRHVLRGLPQSARQRAARSIQTTRANEPGCSRCHGDKVGPFPFEHAPVRLEGCGACHQPHGSANPRMLTRQVVRLVCLECHSNLPVPVPPPNATLGTVPPAFHDLRSPRFQNCTICHQKVHGSYVNRDIFQMRFLLAFLITVAAFAQQPAPQAKPRHSATRQAGGNRRRPRRTTRRSRPTGGAPAPAKAETSRVARALHATSGSPAASISAIAGWRTCAATFPPIAASSIWAKDPSSPASTSPSPIPSTASSTESMPAPMAGAATRTTRLTCKSSSAACTT